MRRSSKIILAVCLVLAVVLAAVFVPMFLVTQPDFTEKDANEMLTKLAEAFHRKSTSDVLSFAAPDAVVAGRVIAPEDLYGKGKKQ